MKEIKHILFYEILQGKILNAVLFPFAYTFREKLKKGNYLYGYLHDGNLYGDADFKPNMENGLAKAWLWAMRNPLHNRYYAGMEDFKNVNFSGYATTKFKTSPATWRTFTTETGSRNGKIINWDKSLFGKQDITFDIKFKNKTVKGYRKSTCKPFRMFNRIIIHSRRIGYENGLKQSSFNFSIKKGKENIEGYERWKKLPYVRNEI